MALVKATMMMELAGTFASTNPTALKPGQDIAKAFKNYLMMGMNAGGFPTSNVVDAGAGAGIGGVFAQQLPVGAAIGSQIATQLSTMALTYLSGQQIGPPITAPTHLPGLIQLFSGPKNTGMEFAKELAGILDDWTKTWIVSGMIPGAPPIPFSGPLS
jgi:hypothetical protein|tara:strand:- start:422 stop:895 length:474 start_codon:yes stop_codon:yes gene_type:complete